MHRWPLHKSWFWQKAPFFRLLIPLILAIGCYDRGWLPAGAFPLWICLACSLTFLALALLRKHPATIQVLTFLALQGCLFGFGWWCAAHRDVRNDPAWFGQHMDTSALHLVKVTAEPAGKARSWRIPVEVMNEIKAAGIKPVNGQALLTLSRKDSLAPYARGDLLLLPAHWQPVSNAGNPFEFDYVTFCRRKQIFYQQFVADDDVQLYRLHVPQQAGLVDHLHDYCARQLRIYFKDTAVNGLMQAMLLGDESSFDPVLRQAYADTGVIHIVSISGSHVAVLFLVVTSLLFWLKGTAGKWIRYAVGLAFIWLYVLMAGAPPSAVRAAVMFSIVAVSITVARQSYPLNTLLAAAFILLCANPYWLFAVGFQLSFCAVLSLLLFYQPVYRLWSPPTRIGRWLWQAVAASIAAELLTAPLGIYYFHNFPLFFIIANILAMILLSFLALAGGMAVIVLSWLPVVAQGIAACITMLVRLFNFLMLTLQRYNPVSLHYLQLSLVELLLLYCTIAGIAWGLLQRRRSGLYGGLIAAILLVTSLCMNKYQVLHQERLIVYNTYRQMQAELVQGNRYRPLSGSDTTMDIHYVVRQAHTGWQAWHHNPRKVPDCFVFKGKTVLRLKEDVALSDSFPVDLLIIDRPLKGLSPSAIRSVFHPGQVVVGGNQPRGMVRKWQDSCTVLGLPFHPVSAAGAYVFQ